MDLNDVLEYYAATNDAPISDVRREKLTIAVSLGADENTLKKLCDALGVNRGQYVVLPPNRLENLSRGRGWCRKGQGDSATWGERVEYGYRVGPGRWTVGGSDGFSRKKSDVWNVEHIQVGAETWTIAS